MFARQLLLHDWWATHDVEIALGLLLSEEGSMALRSPVCTTRVMRVPCAAVQLRSVLLLHLHLRTVLHRLDTMAVLTSVLDALVDVAYIDGLELVPLRCDLGATPSSCNVHAEVEVLVGSGWLALPGVKCVAI